MAWIDYRNAYDMVPHSGIIESLKLAYSKWLAQYNLVY